MTVSAFASPQVLRSGAQVPNSGSAPATTFTVEACGAAATGFGGVSAVVAGLAGGGLLSQATSRGATTAKASRVLMCMNESRAIVVRWLVAVLRQQWERPR